MIIKLIQILSIFNVLILHNQNINERAFEKREVRFGERIFQIPLLNEYCYFNQSSHKNTKLNEYTEKNLLSNNRVHDLELLIPKNSNLPLIHIFSYKELAGLNISPDLFNTYKNTLTKNFKASNLDSIYNILKYEKKYKKELGQIEPNFDFAGTTLNLENRLVTVVYSKTKLNKTFVKSLIVSNYLHLKETILVIRFTYTFDELDYSNFMTFQNEYISLFINKNIL
jgi:hypothetical protein